MLVPMLSREVSDMPRRIVTRSDVESFQRWCTEHYFVLWLDKASLPGAEYVRTVADALHALVPGAPTGTQLVDEDWQTIGLVVLTGSSRDPATDLCACVHELTHALNFEHHPDRAIYLYVASDEARANFEGGAYLAGAEARIELEGVTDDPAWVRETLAAQYLVSPAAADLGADVYRQGLTAVLSADAVAQANASDPNPIALKTTPGGKAFAAWLAEHPLPIEAP
jgi:hypothetical protein